VYTQKIIKLLRRLAGIVLGSRGRFESAGYWQNRYQNGGTSGAGSYGRLADWKARVLNGFVEDKGIVRVLELGCGDGNQLSLANYPEYAGFDVASAAVERCRNRFTGKPWQFALYSPEKVASAGRIFKPDLALSLDVIFHLVEDAVFHEYMKALFSVDAPYVIIYSSNGNFAVEAAHIRDWVFLNWVDANAQQWQLKQHIKNQYPYDPGDPENTSFSDFYVFEKQVSTGTE